MRDLLKKAWCIGLLLFVTNLLYSADPGTKTGCDTCVADDTAWASYSSALLKCADTCLKQQDQEKPNADKARTCIQKCYSDKNNPSPLQACKNQGFTDCGKGCLNCTSKESDNITAIMSNWQSVMTNCQQNCNGDLTCIQNCQYLPIGSYALKVAGDICSTDGYKDCGTGTGSGGSGNCQADCKSKCMPKGVSAYRTCLSGCALGNEATCDAASLIKLQNKKKAEKAGNSAKAKVSEVGTASSKPLIERDPCQCGDNEACKTACANACISCDPDDQACMNGCSCPVICKYKCPGGMIGPDYGKCMTSCLTSGTATCGVKTADSKSENK